MIATQSFMLHRKQSDQEESVISLTEVNGDLFCIVNRASWSSSLLHLKRIPSPVCYFKTFRVVISHLTQKMRPYSLRVNVFKWSFSVLASRWKLRGSDYNVENVELHNCTFAQINESSTAVKVPGNVLRKKKTKNTHDEILAHTTDQKITFTYSCFLNILWVIF